MIKKIRHHQYWKSDTWFMPHKIEGSQKKTSTMWFENYKIGVRLHLYFSTFRDIFISLSFYMFLSTIFCYNLVIWANMHPLSRFHFLWPDFRFEKRTSSSISRLVDKPQNLNLFFSLGLWRSFGRKGYIWSKKSCLANVGGNSVCKFLDTFLLMMLLSLSFTIKETSFF